jgi:uncharacterized protein YdaT
MPWSESNVPPPAKNWSKERQRRCIKAGNSVLRNGGLEQDAIFACIHAARVKQEPDDYDRLAEQAANLFQDLTDQYYDGELTLDEFEERFQEAIRDHYTIMMLAALADSREVTEADRTWIEDRVAKEFSFLSDFVEDIRSGRMTEQRAVWRAGLYGYPRAAWVRFSLPEGIAELMGVLPGDDCLGGSLCGCDLQVEMDDDGGAYVYWVLDPLKESCAVCIAHAVESPYYFSPEEVLGVS